MNRALAHKAERAQRQRRDAARAEFTKSCYARHETLASANAIRAETAALVAAFKGEVTVCKPGHPTTEHKRAGYGTRSDLMMTRRAGGGMQSRLTTDVYNLQSRLIPAQR